MAILGWLESALLFHLNHCFQPSWASQMAGFPTQDYHTSFYSRNPLMPGGRKPSRQLMQPTGAPHGRKGGKGGPLKPSSSELQGRSLWMVQSPWRLWWVTPQHHIVLVMYCYLLKQLSLMFHYNTPTILPGMWGTPGAGDCFGGYLCKLASGSHGCWGLWSWWVGPSFLWGPFS